MIANSFIAVDRRLSGDRNEIARGDFDRGVKTRNFDGHC